MHRYTTDRIDAHEPGMRVNERCRMLIDGGGGSTPPPTGAKSTLFKRLTEDRKSVPVTPTDQVREAVKDGKISKQEQTAFDKTPVTKTIVKDEQSRLEKAVKEAGGAPRSNPLAKPDGVSENSYNANVFVSTDHELRVRELSEGKQEGRDLAGIDAKIKNHQGTAEGLEVLKQERSERAGTEAQVASVIEDRESLIGTLEAEKTEITRSGSDDAADDYQVLRTEAQPWIEQFNANGGQYYEGNDLFGDDWDASEVDFDRLAERFHSDPDKLAQFATVQGHNDGDDIAAKSASEYQEYLADRDPADAERIDARFQAAQELTKVFERYDTARNSSDTSSGRIGQIDDQVGALTALNVEDRAVLSASTIAQLDAANEQTPGIIEDENTTDVEPAADEKPPADETDPAPADTAPADGAEGSSTPPEHPGTVDSSETPGAAIDYNTPERRSEVLATAQEQNLLPAANTSFGADGQAVYSVQRGDSYWRISDMSDGKPSNEFDMQHFQANLQSNSQRLGRDPQVGMLDIGDEIILPNRSIDDLVKLLNLPTVEQAPAEEPAPDHGPASHPGVPQAR